MKLSSGNVYFFAEDVKGIGAFCFSFYLEYLSKFHLSGFGRLKTGLILNLTNKNPNV